MKKKIEGVGYRGIPLCVTYILFSAAGPHTDNDIASKDENGTDGVDDHHGNKTTFNRFDVTAVVQLCRFQLSAENGQTQSNYVGQSQRTGAI